MKIPSYQGADMARNKLFGFMFILGVMSNIAFGDGRFFLEKVPVGIPYQRAVLIFEDGKETLVLQSKYKTFDPNNVNSIGWVVPVPSVPELASMDASNAQMLFFFMGVRSQPTTMELGFIFTFTSIIGLISILIGMPFKKLAIKWWRIAIGVFIGLVLIPIFFMPKLGKSTVDILEETKVGIYDVKVIKGDDANAITQWLRENKFEYGPTDLKVFEQYVKKNWCFVTARVNKKTDLKSSEVMSEGLVAPLILRFNANEAVYPMALTATASSETKVLLYVCADHKMDCAGKLKLAFFGETPRPFDKNDFRVKPDGFFKETESGKWYMCKFKGTLTQEQMNEDIIFKQAKDDKPYREIKWW
jgi:hypothetical protein